MKEVASHLPKAVGAALSITRAKELKINSTLSEDAVILCSFGDATVNHSVAQGAFNSAQSETARKTKFAELYSKLNRKKNLSQLLNLALIDLLLHYKNAIVFGEDVSKKGGIYRVTSGLVERFGQRRVFDTLLDETTILGTAIGLSMNGFLPVPEIQFLAYYHNAEDQIRGEAATLPFFSKSQYTNPMVIRIASFGYQKGFGGHFHNDNSIAVLRDIPGLIIASPSNGLDAVQMLRKYFELAETERRLIVFLEPIALYMKKDLHEAGDNLWLSEYPELNTKNQIQFGKVGTHGESEAFVIITYANGYYLSRQAQKILKDHYHMEIKIIDLRWLSPRPKKSLKRAMGKAKTVLIVDEGRKTASLSEEIITWMVEAFDKLPKIERLTGEDSFIPLGDAWQYVLPSKEDIVERVRAMGK